jgi:hypothetical protein
MNVNTPFLGVKYIELLNIRASVQDKACDLQEQRIMAQIVLHPQLMSNTNAPRLVVHLAIIICKYEESSNKTLSTELVDTELFQQVKILK